MQAALTKEAQDILDNKPTNSNTGLLLSQLLMHYYALKEIDLATLLSFCLWPEYLKHFGKFECMYVSFPINCKNLNDIVFMHILILCIIDREKALLNYVFV